MKRLILYDLDGTLVDTLADITAAANHMLEALQAPRRPRSEIRPLIGRGLRELVRSCLGTDDEARIAEGLRVYREYYGRHLVDQSRLYPGARETLEHFRARRQAVITNKPNPYSRDLLAALGVGGYFFDIVAGDGRYPKKPDPASIRALMACEGVSSSEVLLIGDSPIDLQTGRAAGVTTVAIRHGFSDPDALEAERPTAVVAGFPELLALASEQRW